MNEETESWPLGSGIWHRAPATEQWRLHSLKDGSPIDARLVPGDVGLLLGGRRDDKGAWFPPEFAFSPASGEKLSAFAGKAKEHWIPPFGGAPIRDLSKPQGRGLRRTHSPLRVARSHNGRALSATSDPARYLPPLPPGEYRFITTSADSQCPALIGVGVAHGTLHLFLPESQQWASLEQETGSPLAEMPAQLKGWTMASVNDSEGSRFYLPTTAGLAAVRPKLMSLRYEVQYAGNGAALGGPVAWAGEVWIPIRGKDGKLELLGVAPGKKDLVLKTGFASPAAGFESPMYDGRMVVWPCSEGQLVIRLDQDGKEVAEWIGWPEGRAPHFGLGSAYLSPSGSFWLPCWYEAASRFEFVQVGRKEPETFAIDAPRIGTGSIAYKKDQRIKGDPWREPDEANEGASADVIYPLVESEFDSATVNLRLEARGGVLELLENTRDRQRAVLQIQADNTPDVEFGTLMVARPWMTSVFTYDGHLWVYHPDLPKVAGWQLEC